MADMLSLRTPREKPVIPGSLATLGPRNDQGGGAAASRMGGEPAAERESVRAALALALQGFGDLEGELYGLAGVEARVTMRQVVGGETVLADLLRAADAFGDVLAGQFEMHAAGIAALGEVDCEGAVQLIEDAVEDPRLVTGGGGDRVAVHRVDAPHDLATFALHGADQGRQFCLDLVGAHARDQREVAGVVRRVELANQPQHLVGLGGRAASHADRVLDSAQEFDMRAVELLRAVAEPDEMRRAVVPVPGR